MNLLERMRDTPTREEYERGIDAQTTIIWDSLFHEAADEIEHLREQNERIKSENARLTAVVEAVRKRYTPAIAGCCEICDALRALDKPCDDDRIYPCDDCGKMRSKNEGGTTFTVCDECWDKQHGKNKPCETCEGSGGEWSDGGKVYDECPDCGGDDE